MLLEPKKSALFQRDLHNPVPVVVKGEGAYLIDDDGKRYLDASGGPAVSPKMPKIIPRLITA